MTFIELYPPPEDAHAGPDRTITPLDVVGDEERTAPRGRPWVLTNMIASADGATALDGVSGGLGGDADGMVFAALRAVADAIVVGASTVRLEDYRPPSGGSEEAAAARASRGQAPRPLLVIVTASLSVEPDQRSFTDSGYRPLVATVPSAPTDRRAALDERAEVIDCGIDQVDLSALLAELGRRGHRVVLSEGGPSLNGQLIADDLIDEWNLTISPILAAGDSKRPAQGPPLPHPAAPMKLRRVWQADELLFCRWTRS